MLPGPDPLDPQHFGFLDLDHKKYADPRIRIQGVKYQWKTENKNFFISNPKTELLKKEIIQIYEEFNEFYHKNVGSGAVPFQNYNGRPNYVFNCVRPNNLSDKKIKWDI